MLALDEGDELLGLQVVRPQGPRERRPGRGPSVHVGVDDVGLAVPVGQHDARQHDALVRQAIKAGARPVGLASHLDDRQVAQDVQPAACELSPSLAGQGITRRR